MRTPPSPSARRATLREVAAAAKVSLAAASFALNGTGSVSAQCRRRVCAAAARLGYRPDKRVTEIMRRVRRDRHAAYRETLAILDMWPTRGGWHEPVANHRYRDGLRARTAELGYELEEHWFGAAGMTPKRIADILLARGIRGLIVPPVMNQDAGHQFGWEDFTAITFGPSLQIPVNRVCNHRFRTVRTAIENLQRLGYSRIGFVMARHPLPIVEDFWCSGFTSHQVGLGRTCTVPLLLHPPTAYNEVSAWYRRHRPDAVLFHELEQLEALTSAGLRPGRNGAVAYLNWAPGSVNLAGVDQQCELMGATAVDCLMGQLIRHETGLPRSPQEIMIDCVWRDGPSAPQKK